MKIVSKKTGGNKAAIVTARELSITQSGVMFDSGSRVVMDHVTLHKATDEHYQLRTTFDFTDVDYKDVLRLAAETLVIRWRGAFKNADKVDETADNQIVNVKKQLRGAKPRMSREDKLTRIFAEMTKEEKAALLAQLSADSGIDHVSDDEQEDGKEQE